MNEEKLNYQEQQTHAAMLQCTIDPYRSITQYNVHSLTVDMYISIHFL